MKDTDLLRDNLQQKLALIENNNKIKKELEDDLANRFNIKYARSYDIFNGFERIETMPYHMLYKLTFSIKSVISNYSDVIDSSGLNVDSYFTEIEKVEYEKPIVETKKEEDMVIKDWKYISVGQFSYYRIDATIDDVIKWADTNRLRFNPETQRDLIVVETNGIPIKKFDLNRKSVESMKERMIDGTYFPVPALLNINPELYDEFPLVFKGGNLIIPAHVKVDLIEGFHNYIAATEVKYNNPDWEYPYEFKLYLLNKEGANRCIAQMNEKNLFRDTQTARLNVAPEISYLVNTLNTSSDFLLNRTITSEMCLYLYKVVEKIFDVTKMRDAILVLSKLKNNLNHVIIETNHFDCNFTKEEWFVYMYLTKISIDNNVDFNILFNSAISHSVIDKITINKMPRTVHYKLIKDLIAEVVKNV